ncbi:MAG: sigma-70 family RNA polymerase sigma factor [Chitinophagales bacterium]|nr:sigma-70 family RNA polymerase sigma factor [Chitinophagales bacterium]
MASNLQSLRSDVSSIQQLFTNAMQQLQEIQTDLSKGDSDTFQHWIELPFKEKLGEWLPREYPLLKEEASDILHDVFRKIQQRIKKWEPGQENLDIEKELWSLAQKECKLAQPTPENRQKNLGLSRSEFKKLCALLKQGEETLIEKVYLSHFEKCMNHLIFKEHANKEEAYNCSMDALYEIRKDLLQDKIFYGNLAYYFTYRAKRKLYRWRGRQKQSPLPLNGLDFEEEEKTESDLIQNELAELIAEAINRLCADCKSMIRSYYYEEESLKEIAEKIGKSHAAIRKQITRCRDKLRKLLGENFYEQFSSYLNG